MQRRRGISLISSSSLEFSTPGRSFPSTGSVAGVEPLAIMALSAHISSHSPSAPQTVTHTPFSAALKDACPRTRRMSLFFSRNSMPARSCAVTASFLSIAFSRSMDGATAPSSASVPGVPALMPNSAARRISSSSDALFHRVLVGMQPSFRQVPPTGPSLTRVTSIPLLAASTAVS